MPEYAITATVTRKSSMRHSGIRARSAIPESPCSYHPTIVRSYLYDYLRGTDAMTWVV